MNLDPATIELRTMSSAVAPLERLELNPADGMGLAAEFFKTGQFEEAHKIYAMVASVEPQNWEAAQYAGLSLSNQRRYNDALPWYDRAAAIAVTELNLTTLNKSVALGEAGHSEEGLRMLDGMLHVQPNHAQALYNKGVLLMQLDRFDEALVCFERSIELDPTRAEEWGNSVFCRGFANLVLGNYLDGFRDFEHRLKDNIYAKAGPAQGEELRWDHLLPDIEGVYKNPPIWGATVLVLSVMGRGDVIQFGRFLPLLVERGARVLVTADRGTEQLFSDIPGVTVFAETDVLPASDYWCHMMGLAHVFQITVDTVPPPLPLIYSSELLAKWRMLIPNDGVLNVGLCWAGNPNSRYDEHRTIPLEMFRPLIALCPHKRVRFHCLQQTIRDIDIPTWDDVPMSGVGFKFTDFRQTAHAMKCLDLVITVDTSVAHMAGTVGVPTWILTTRFRTYWLWLKGRNDTPWYPSVELIRQPVHGSWPSAIEVTRDKLLGLLTAR